MTYAEPAKLNAFGKGVPVDPMLWTHPIRPVTGPAGSIALPAPDHAATLRDLTVVAARGRLHSGDTAWPVTDPLARSARNIPGGLR